MVRVGLMGCSRAMTVQILICPGVHQPEFTDDFLVSLGMQQAQVLIVPTDQFPPYSGRQVLGFIRQRCDLAQPLLLIGFSAGVVGGFSAALGWQHLGGKLRALIALDGWGVPLWGDFPIHRLSHDYFTHWSSGFLGTGAASFYADPPAAHLELWRSPQMIWGWSLTAQSKQRITAAAFLQLLLETYSS